MLSGANGAAVPVVAVPMGERECLKSSLLAKADQRAVSTGTGTARIIDLLLVSFWPPDQ